MSNRLERPTQFARSFFAAVFLFNVVSALAESQTISIDFAKTAGPALQRASGFLHSISSTLPSDDLVFPIKPKAFRMTPANNKLGESGWAFESGPRIAKMGASLQVVVSDAFGYGGQFGIHPERKDVWPGDNGDWSLLRQCLEELVTESKKTNCPVQWDIWNEADIVSFWNPTGDKKARFFETWKQAWQIIKSLDPQAVIVGPSNGYYNNQVYSYSNGLFTVEEFLEFAKANAVLPDILSWHIWHEKDITPTVTQARAFMKAHNINISRISLNEIVHGDHQNDPGMHVWYFADIEQAGVDSACRACWPDDDKRSSCWDATLCNLVTYPDRKPRATWWAYKAYADITGELTPVIGTADIAGVAGKDAKLSQARILLGKKAGEKSAVTLKLSNLNTIFDPKNKPDKLRIVIQKIPNTGWAALENPTTVRDETASATNDLEIPISDFGASEAYIITLSPAN